MNKVYILYYLTDIKVNYVKNNVKNINIFSQTKNKD